MGPHNPHAAEDQTKLQARRYVTAADYFLRNRNFVDCHKFALQAKNADPTDPDPTRMLSTVAVLSVPKISSERHDYYAILNLSQFESDPSRIGSSFQTLKSILNPKVNLCPVTTEAFDLVLKAWSVLSNPFEKAKFDSELKGNSGSGTSVGEGCTFWTMCPYCYYVYEYDRAFEECSLKCVNERCQRVLHGVAFDPPPPEVVEKGYYCCPGFLPFSLRNDKGEEIGDNVWVPFPASGREVSENQGYVRSSYLNSEVPVVNISEGQKVSVGNSEDFEGMSFQDQSNGKRSKLNVHWDSKKLGTEIKNERNEGHPIYEICGEGDLNLEPEGAVEFFEGDDDVL